MLNQLGLGFTFTGRDLVTGVIGRVENSFHGLERQAESATRALGANLAQFGQGLAIAGAGIAGLAVLNRAVEAAGEFEHAVAEVSTLIDESTFSTAELSRVSLELAAFYGGTATAQARALYQTISAGVTDAARATELLRVANELAVGGVTDTRTAVDALTNVVNAYAASGAEARDVSDAFFVAIRAGKTTAAELAATIGRVAPTASSLGVSFSDLLASVAAVTTQGLNTSEAVTGMKAALANVIKPTADATAEAARLGIRFDAATLRARGLSGFLDMVTSSAGFNADSLSKLFGSVEGLNAVMALTANSSSKFHEILGQMDGRSGATRAAFEKMADELTFLQGRFGGLARNVLILIGQALKPAIEAIVRLASTVLDAFTRIPKPIREFGVRLFAAVSLVLALVGGFIAAKAGLALLALGVKAAGIAVGGLLASLLPLIAALAAVALVVTGFAVAFRRDIGGIATFFENAWARIKLLFQGLAQLFEEGGFSGAVRDELNRAENAGIKQFAIRVFQIAFRIKRIFGGIAEGFGAAIEAARPVFDAFVGALRRLGQALGIVGMAGADAAAGIPSDKFAAFGRVIGKIAGILVDVFVGSLTFVINVVTKAIDVFREVFGSLQPIFDGVKQAVSVVWQELQKLGAMFGFASAEGGRASGAMDKLRAVAEFLGSVVGGMATAIVGSIGFMVQFVVRRLSFVVTAFRALVGHVQGVIEIFGAIVTGEWANIWVGFKKVALNALNFLAQMVLGFVESLAGIIDSIAGLFGADFGAADAIKNLRANIEKGLVGGVETVTAGVEVRPTRAASGAPGAATAAFPAATAAEAQILALERAAGGGPPVRVEASPVTTHINLTVDGEVLASAVRRAERGRGARSFLPVPVGE